MKITRIEPFRHKLGEGPVWDVVEQALYGTDVLGRKFWRYDPVRGDYDAWTTGDTVSSIALCETGGALLALSSGLYMFDFSSGKQTLISNAGAEKPELILNDGKVDRAGRFVYGNVHTSGRMGEAALYSIASDFNVNMLDNDFIVTNGPCWSPDGNIFYFSDSVRKNIYAYDYDMTSGAVAGRRIFVDTGKFAGIPDGATVDADGYLWTAICGGSEIVRFKPDGTVDLVIGLPTPAVSSVMFGGADLDRLFVTSINSEAAAAEIPLAANSWVKSDENSGALFVIDGLGIRGMPECRFKR